MIQQFKLSIDNIKQLISNGETKTLELKKTTGELKDAMHTACAFLNTDGGWLIFGVTPVSLKIVGQDVNDITRQEIANAISGLEPSVDVNVEYVEVPDSQGRMVIAMHFDGWAWGNIPYSYRGCPYYRVESTTKTMPRDMWDDRVRASKPNKYAWENQESENVTVSDLNANLVRGAVRLGVERGRMMELSMTEPLDVILGKWNLLVNGKLNNAAVALFTNNIHNYPQLKLRMARFRGNDKSEFIDNVRAEGNLFEMLEAGMAFLFKHLSQSAKINGITRNEQLEIPVSALREALINALCHRQYEIYNATPGIAIYDDRIEIGNPGIFPPQLNAETIKLPHISYPYNPIMANVLFKTAIFENWGSGVERIVESCHKQGLKEPTWSVNCGFIVVTFFREKSGTCLQLANNLPNEVKQLIISIGEDRFTKKEILELGKLPYKSREIVEEKCFAPAQKLKLIEMLYPDKPNHPKQKYFLTEKGLEVWKVLSNKKEQ